MSNGSNWTPGSNVFAGGGSNNPPPQQGFTPGGNVFAPGGGGFDQPQEEEQGFAGNVMDALGLSAPKDNFMALGETQLGEGDYGEGFSGWARKTFAKFADPSKRREGIDYKRQDQIKLEAQKAADEWAARNPNLANFKDYYFGAQQALKLDAEKIKQGGAGAAIGVGLQEAGNLLKTGLIDVGIMGALQLGDIGTRKLFSAGQAVDEIANTSANVTKWNPFEGQSKWVEQNFGEQAATLARNLNPLERSWNLFRYAQDQWEKGDIAGAAIAGTAGAVGALTGPLGALIGGGVTGATTTGNNAQEQAVLDRNLRASNMLYTQMFDDQARAEIMRRIESGESLASIEESLTNPWAELGGSLLLDPLNLVGAGAGKAAKATKMLEGAEDLTKIAPEVADALGALGKADDVVDAQKYMTAVQNVSDSITAKTKQLTKLASDYAPTALTANGKQFVTGRITGDYVKLIVGNLGGEDAAQFFRNMIDLGTTTDAARKAELMAWFAKTKGGSTVFSDAGYTTMATMKALIPEGKTADEFVSGLLKTAGEFKTPAEKTEALAKAAASHMQGAMDKIFPTVDDIKKLDPEKYKALPEHVKILNTFAGKESTLGTVYRKMNGLFAGVYMGLSPSFAIRNAITNSVGIMADQGVGAGLAAMRSQLGDFFKPGALHKRHMDDLQKIFKTLPADLMDVKTLADDVGSNFGALGVSGRMEQAARAALMRNSAVREIERGIRAGMPSADSLLKSGFSEAQTSYLYDAILRNKGDIEAAVREFSEYVGKNGGAIETRTMMQPTTKLRGFLQKINMDGVFDGVRAGAYKTKEEFAAALDNIVENVKSLRDAGAAEYARVAENSTEAKLIDDIIGGLGKGSREAMDTAFNHASQAMATARESAYNAARKFGDEQFAKVIERAKATGDVNLIEIANKARQGFNDAVAQVALEPLGKETYGKFSQHRTAVRAWVDAVRNGTMEADELLGKLDLEFPGGTRRFSAKELMDVAGVNRSNIGDFVYQQWLPTVGAEWWNHFNDIQYKQVYEQIAKLGGNADEVLNPARELMGEGMRIFDAIVAAKGQPTRVEDLFAMADDAAKAADAPTRIGELIAQGEKAGVSQYQVMNHFKKVGEEMTEDAVRAYLKTNGVDIAETATAAVRKYVPPAGQHSFPQMVAEQYDGFAKEMEAFKQAALSKWGEVLPGAQKLDGDALGKWAREAENRMVTVRQTAMQVARNEADFALHAYGDKTYIDAAMSFVYPYHYWYGRSYQKWAQRLAYNPELFAAYGKYRRTMEQMHAGLPEWWKYNLSTNDLPGVDMENPLYFNLEATLNPINGLTGTDFNDSKKRVDWLSRTVDDLGKFGPSMFTPLSWMVAAKLYNDGEKDASARWMGRLLPQSNFAKVAATAAGVDLGEGVFGIGKNNEFDPFVALFQGGLDPYERNRVGAAVAKMVNEGIITEEQGIDAVNQQSGDIWEAAIKRATMGDNNSRAWGQVAGFFGGVGFKTRSTSDIAIDNFYQEYYQLMGASSNIPPDKYREAMAMLGQKYPFMDTVLISRKADDDRNAAYAYNVIGRIPPGQSKDLYEAVGIDGDLIARFYDSKGSFKGWTPQDMQRFMAGIGDLGAYLAVPGYKTRQEWNAARTAYGNVTEAMKQTFGNDIVDKIDHYYSLPSGEQQRYMDAHPEIAAAFDFKNQATTTDPLLYRYYGGIDKLEKFYRGQMYAALDEKYGKDISQKWDEYYALQLSDPKGAKTYYKQHPELAAYSKDKSAWNKLIGKQSARVAAMMPDGPAVQVRSDFAPQSATQEALAAAGQPEQVVPWNEWQQVLSEPLQRVVLDYFVNDEKLSSAATRQLDYLAKQYGYKDGDELLNALGVSIYRAQGQQ